MKRLLIINTEKDRDDIVEIPKIKEAISSIEDTQFTVIHHSKVSKKTLDDINPDLLYLTGRVTHDWTIDEIEEDYDATLSMLKNIEIPTLGICAGYQLLAIAHGANFGKMIEVDEGEEDIREKGIQEIEIIKDSPLFKGLEKSFHCHQNHRDEVKSVPNDFELLASTEMCKLQAIKHRDKDLYGVQFHPELYTEEYPDGKTILKNFLSLK